MKADSIAICVIAKNEENNIRAWYKSVEGLFDQYVFVDTGSTDKTVEIANELGLEVHHFNWIDDFSAARNFSFSKATTDYIFWNDLDDRLAGRDNFVHFKTDVMKISDFWLAPYHYALDANGKSVCTFIRERVVKNGKGFKWNYFIHEGIHPVSNYGNASPQLIKGWWIEHHRTAEDVAKDKSRNLNIFDRKLKDGPLDARMRYYYGKELFEQGKVKESIPMLNSALSDRTLELHDRILAVQYLTSAYMMTEDYGKAMEFAHMGLMLAPTRAEFYCMLSDVYLKTNQVPSAIPFLQAAKHCMKPPEGTPTAIFHNDGAYFEYPRNQLSRAYFHLGNLEAARREATDCLALRGDKDARDIVLEIDRVKTISQGYMKALPCEDIVFTTPPQTAYEFDPKLANEKAMGGSETALMEMAHHLHKLTGRKVKVFNMRQSAETFDGVEYFPVQGVHEYFTHHKPCVHIAWRHNNKLTDARTFVWSHDLFTPGAEAVDHYEKIFCLTPFHARYMQTTQNVPERKIWITRNGINPEKFPEPVLEWKKDPWKFIFSSSPDRGLDRAMRVLDKVRIKCPEIKLHIYYGIEHLDKFGHKALRDQLTAMMDERKDWVIYHGATQQHKLMDELRSAAYCVQPSDWIETSMISAIERLCTGVYQIIRAVGGCVDTLSEAKAAQMATLVDSECVTETQYQTYVDATIKAIEEKAYQRIGVIDPEPYSWENVAKEWCENFGIEIGNGLAKTG